MCTKGKITSRRALKSLLKDHPSPVYSSLIGNALTNKNLVVLENHKIIMIRDHRKMQGKVKIIGGGGAGIEPAESFYVGKGMLTAAVVGEIFTAPPANEILVAIRELGLENPDGVLLLVKNYVGDRLNFGLALDKALKEDINVKMLVVGDNITEVPSGKFVRKGLAGSILVYKIAGEMAEEGKTLEEIIYECRHNILTDLATVSLTLAPCGGPMCDSLTQYIEHDEVVFGMGIYGQHGVKKLKVNSLSQIISIAREDLIGHLNINSEGDKNVVVLVNNLGATSKLEESVVVEEISKQLSENKVKVVQLYSGSFMTSYACQGFSITLLKINSADTLKYLNASTSAPAWPKSDSDYGEIPDPAPVTVPAEYNHEQLNKAMYDKIPFGSNLSDKAVNALKQILIFAAEALISCERQLNIIDSEAGDGDAGSVLKNGAQAIKEAVLNDSIDIRRPARFLIELSEICCTYMGGLTGALYNVFFSSAAKYFQTADEITPEVCCMAFRAAVKAIKHYGKAELKERTVLDALCPAVDSFENAIANGKNLTEAMYQAAATCEFKAEETKCMKPPWMINYDMTNKSLLYADAGAHAATIWFRAVSEGLKLNYPPEC